MDKKVVCLLILSSVGVDASMQCSVFAQFGDFQYCFINQRMYWNIAVETCSDMGWSLAVPYSADEHSFIWNMFTGAVQSGNVWIGCSKSQVTDKWVQPGGKECHYANWAPGEPNGQYCLQMWRARGGLLDDTFCSHWSFMICKRSRGKLRSAQMTRCVQADASGRFAFK